MEANTLYPIVVQLIIQQTKGWRSQNFFLKSPNKQFFLKKLYHKLQLVTLNYFFEKSEYLLPPSNALFQLNGAKECSAGQTNEVNPSCSN